MPLLFPYNYHTHSTYCDGRATLAEMAEAAYKLGFQGLGFTGHLYDRRAARWSMSEEGAARYRSDIARLKEEYRGRMEILCGCEADLWTTDDLSVYELIIASVHCFKEGDVFTMVDQKPEDLQGLADRLAGGDMYRLAQLFYEMEASIPERFKRVDIIGHLDYFTKFNRGNFLLDETDPRYIKAYNDALDALMPLDAVFEVNVSPFYRGKLDRFYPSDAIIKEIFRRGGRITIAGDCHYTENLYQAFDKAIEAVTTIGFRSAVVFTENGPKEVGLLCR